MSFTYEPTTNIGRVRRTIPDKVELEAFWSDEEIQSFLNDEGGDWRRACALALETMASDNLLVMKVIRVQDVETNTDRMAKLLMDRAKNLRELSAIEDSTTGDSFEVAEVVVTDWQFRERVYNQALRS